TGTAALLTSETAGAGTTSDGKPYSGDTVGVTGTASGTFASKDVANGINVSVSGLSLTNNSLGDYSLTAPSLTANITAKALTVSGLSVAARTYDATTTETVSGSPALASAEAPGAGTTVDGKPYSGDTVTINGSATGTFASKDVGTAIGVTISGLSSSNADYTLTMPSLSANITAKALTISGLSATSRTYDATTVAGLTGTAALLTSETAGAGTTSDGKPYSGDTVGVTGTASGTFASKDVANGINVSVSGLSLTNNSLGDYSLTAPSLTANITAKALTVSGLSVAFCFNDTATTETVSGSPALASAEAPGAGTTVDGKPYSGDTVTINGSATGTFASKDVGTAIGVTISGLSSSNADYTLTMPSLSANITAKALTISGLSATSRTYDATTVAGITGTAALLTSETAGAGTTSDGKPYSGDTVGVTGTASGTFASKDVANGINVSVSGLSLTNNSLGDYSLTAPSLTANITAKALTVSGLSVAFCFNDTATTETVSGSPALASAEAP